MSSILLIQSSPVLSGRYCAVLGTDPRYAVFGVVSTLAQARAAIAQRVPDLLISDVRLRDGLLANLLDELRPSRSHVLVIVNSLRDPYLLHALRHGGDACLLSGAASWELLSGVRQLLAGESPMAPETARQLLAHFDIMSTRPVAAGDPAAMKLTEAETRTLQSIGAGHLPEDIARNLDLTSQQVGLMMRAVYRRLHLEWRSRPATPRTP